MTPGDLADEFDRAAGRAGALGEVLDKFVEVMNVSIQKNFDAEGRPARWAEIQRMHPGHKAILHDTGALRGSAKAIREGNDVILVAGGNGQPQAKAPALHHGAQLHNKRKVATGRFAKKRSRNADAYRYGGTLPDRPFLLFHPDDLAYLGDELPSFIFMGRKWL